MGYRIWEIKARESPDLHLTPFDLAWHRHADALLLENGMANRSFSEKIRF